MYMYHCVWITSLLYIRWILWYTYTQIVTSQKLLIRSTGWPDGPIAKAPCRSLCLPFVNFSHLNILISLYWLNNFSSYLQNGFNEMKSSCISEMILVESLHRYPSPRGPRMTQISPKSHNSFLHFLTDNIVVTRTI